MTAKTRIAVVPTRADSPLGQLVHEMQSLQEAHDRFEELKKRIKVLVEQFARIDEHNSADVHVDGIDRALRVSLGSRTLVDTKRLMHELPEVHRAYSNTITYPQASWVNR